MEEKIQKLTEKIYQDGVQKGNEKAQALIEEAQTKAAGFIAEAKSEAEQIIADAKHQAEELKRNTESEIRVSGAQAIASIKQQILDIISAHSIDNSTTEVLSDPATVKKFITLIIEKWRIGNTPLHLEALLPEQKQREFTDAFKKDASGLMKKGLQVSFSKSIKAGFRIGPKNGSFKISLSDEDFAVFFKEFLRPKTRTWLFGE